MQLTSTVNAFEVAWTVFCLPGMLVAFRLLIRANGDVMMLRRNKINSFREYSAVTTITLFLVIALVQFIYVIIGIYLMTQANAIHSNGSSVVAVLFIFSSLILNIGLWGVEVRRERLIEMIAEVERGIEP